MHRTFLVALLVAMAGCAGAPGNEEDAAQSQTQTQTSTGGNATQTETVELVPVTIDVGLTGAYPVNIAYDPARIEVAADNEVTIVFTNNDENPLAPHNWVLEGVDGAATQIINNGQTTEVTFPAPSPGEYAFFCSVGDHRDQGMEGTFVVNP